MGGPVIEKDTTYVAGISTRLAGCSTARILSATSLPSPLCCCRSATLGIARVSVPEAGTLSPSVRRL
jgi:hypothetical protein